MKIKQKAVKYSILTNIIIGKEKKYMSFFWLAVVIGVAAGIPIFCFMW